MNINNELISLNELLKYFPLSAALFLIAHAFSQSDWGCESIFTSVLGVLHAAAEQPQKGATRPDYEMIPQKGKYMYMYITVALQLLQHA